MKQITERGPIQDGYNTFPKCDECQRYVKAVVQVGEELDYESYTARLCLDCVRKAYALASEETTETQP